jgi:hypothetical protein
LVGGKEVEIPNHKRASLQEFEGLLFFSVGFRIQIILGLTVRQFDTDNF